MAVDDYQDNFSPTVRAVEEQRKAAMSQVANAEYEIRQQKKIMKKAFKESKKLKNVLPFLKEREAVLQADVNFLIKNRR